MDLTFREVMTLIWNLLPLHAVQHPIFWQTFSEMLEEPVKSVLVTLVRKWQKQFHLWQIGLLLGLEKKLSKVVDFTFPIFWPATTEEELEAWLLNWYGEHDFTPEASSSSLSTMITSTPSTTALIQTGRVAVRSKGSKKQKRTLEDFFADLGESKRSKVETGRIVSNITVRKDGQLRTVSSEGRIKDFVLKVQVFPTLEYQAMMQSKPNDACRTVMNRSQLSCVEKDEMYQKVLEILSLGREDILRSQQEDSK
ncbi:hypothetical protein HHI36_007578 [Cryptolaemus montrouzieri]|uniref:Uncharacterized protein n=1 Tax=Cryptolaemus montrouzieri TaxID=559131 RepID=A0ABD2MQ81_9CUCU